MATLGSSLLLLIPCSLSLLKLLALIDLYFLLFFLLAFLFPSRSIVHGYNDSAEYVISTLQKETGNYYQIRKEYFYGFFLLLETLGPCSKNINKQK